MSVSTFASTIEIYDAEALKGVSSVFKEKELSAYPNIIRNIYTFATSAYRNKKQYENAYCLYKRCHLVYEELCARNKNGAVLDEDLFVCESLSRTSKQIIENELLPLLKREYESRHGVAAGKTPVAQAKPPEPQPTTSELLAAISTNTNVNSTGNILSSTARPPPEILPKYPSLSADSSPSSLAASTPSLSSSPLSFTPSLPVPRSLSNSALSGSSSSDSEIRATRYPKLESLPSLLPPLSKSPNLTTPSTSPIVTASPASSSSIASPSITSSSAMPQRSVFPSIEPLTPITTPSTFATHASTPMVSSVPGSPPASTFLRPIFLPQSLVKQFEARAEANTKQPPRGKETCAILAGSLLKGSTASTLWLLAKTHAKTTGLPSPIPLPPSGEALVVTHLILPMQSGNADSCEVTDAGDEFLLNMCLAQDLLIFGWIHTHPSQSCFLSSLDLHTHLVYQLQLPESIAVVLAPRDKANSVLAFRLTDAHTHPAAYRAGQSLCGRTRKEMRTLTVPDVMQTERQPKPHGVCVIKACAKRDFHSHSAPVPIYETATHISYLPDRVLPSKVSSSEQSMVDLVDPQEALMKLPLPLFVCDVRADAPKGFTGGSAGGNAEVSFGNGTITPVNAPKSENMTNGGLSYPSLSDIDKGAGALPRVAPTTIPRMPNIAPYTPTTSDSPAASVVKGTLDVLKSPELLPFSKASDSNRSDSKIIPSYPSLG